MEANSFGVHSFFSPSLPLPLPLPLSILLTYCFSFLTLSTAKEHHEFEEAIRKAGIPLTSIRPTSFDSNIFHQAHNIKQGVCPRGEGQRGSRRKRDQEEAREAGRGRVNYESNLIPLSLFLLSFYSPSRTQLAMHA